MRFCLLLVAVLACADLTHAQPQPLPQPPPPQANQVPLPTARNIPAIVKLFDTVALDASKSTVRVRCNGRDAVLGTVVSEDGWILTKTSELHGKLTCTLPDGRMFPATIKGVSEPHDLALLKIEASGLVPVLWTPSKAATIGRWVVSPGPATAPVAIGVISVATRKLVTGDQFPKQFNPNSGILGVNGADAPGGARLTVVTKDGPADKAGLRVGDIITHANGQRVHDLETMQTIFAQYGPGDEVHLKYERGLEARATRATLSKRPPGPLGNPQDHMGSILSKRRGGFPVVLQHDTVLKPHECGGPLVTLDGEVVGLNIARAGRVDSFAIPAETVRDLLPELKSGRMLPSAALLKSWLSASAPKVETLVWNADRPDAGEVRKLTGHTAGIVALALSPDGRHAVTASADKSVRLWDLETGKAVKTFEGHTAAVTNVALAPDGRRLASVDATGLVRLWDVTTGKETAQIVGDPTGKSRGLAFARDGRTLALLSDKGIALWEGEAKTLPLVRLATEGAVPALAVSPDNRFLLTAEGNLARLWDARTAQILAGYEGHRGAVTAVAFTPDGRRLVTGGADCTIRLWDRDNVSELRTFEGHTGTVAGVAIAPDSTRLLSCSLDGTIRLWDLTTAKQVHQFEGHTGGATCVAFSPDGTLAISAGLDQAVRVWRLPR